MPCPVLPLHPCSFKGSLDGAKLGPAWLGLHQSLRRPDIDCAVPWASGSACRMVPTPELPQTWAPGRTPRLWTPGSASSGVWGSSVCSIGHGRHTDGVRQTPTYTSKAERASPLMQAMREVGLLIWGSCINTKQSCLLLFPMSATTLWKFSAGDASQGGRKGEQVCPRGTAGLGKGFLNGLSPPFPQWRPWMELAAAWTHALPPKPPLEAPTFPLMS